MRIFIPAYSRGEEVVDHWIHYAGLIAALVGSVALIVAAVEREHKLTIACVAVCVVGLLAMIGASALYNFAAQSCRKEWFRRLDHAGIFLIIACTLHALHARPHGRWLGSRHRHLRLARCRHGISLKLLYSRRSRSFRSCSIWLSLGSF